MKTLVFKFALILTFTLSFGSNSYAVPILQVGAPAGTGDTGFYADYQPSLTNPIEMNTAVTFGNTLYVGGVYQDGGVLWLGGIYPDIPVLDWSYVGLPDFNNHGAVLVASVPEGTLNTALVSLNVGGNIAFSSSLTDSFFPTPHDPVIPTDADFLFFDIGDFSNTGTVPDFASETGAAVGEIKTLTFSGFESLPWIHFDVMALQTRESLGEEIDTILVSNPISYDVTWKNTSPVTPVPEPGTLVLLVAGLAGLGLFGRKRLKVSKA